MRFTRFWRLVFAECFRNARRSDRSIPSSGTNSRTFFRFCVDSNWLDKNPALAVKSGKVQHVPKAVFSDEEMARILTACRRTPTKSKWGSDMKKRALAMALLLRYSGLRISDASVLEGERLAGDRIFIYTQKTGTPVWVPVPPFVSKALAKCPNHNPKSFSGAAWANGRPQ